MKLQEEEVKRENVIRMKKEKQEEIRLRNLEMHAKAGNKAEEMKQGDMAKYEAKQAQIKQKEREREAERIARNKAKEEEF